jgi:transposase
MRPLRRLKKGLRGWANPAWQRHEDPCCRRCARSLPLAVSAQSASPHESQLVEEVLGHSFLDTLPQRLIGDKAYDCDALDNYLAREYGIEIIAPHRRDRRQTTQDGRPLRRYRKRWRVERFLAWLHQFRRLVTRWEYHIENFLGMVRLGRMRILFRYLRADSCSGRTAR